MRRHAVYNKEIRVWLNEIERIEGEFLTSIPDQLTQIEDNFLPVRFDSTVSITSNNPDESILQQEKAQTLHSDVVSARKIRDYYSKWDKFEANESEKQDKSEPTPKKDTTTIKKSQGNITEITTQNKKRAEAEKEKGNKFFKASQWNEAIACYSACIGLDPMNEIYPLNRAMARIKLEQWDEVITDCDAALSLDSCSVKAFFRKATALYNLKKFKEAEEAIKQAIALDSKNGPAKSLLKKINSALTSKKLPEEKVTAQNSKVTVCKKKEETPAAPTTKKTEELITPVSTVTLSGKTKKKTEVKESLLKETKPIVVKEQKKIEEIKPQPVKEVTASSNEKEDTGPQTIPKVLPVVPETPPSSSFEFERNFINLKGFPELFYKYLQVIPPSSFASIFKSSMSSDIFEMILVTLEKFYAPEERNEEIVEILRGISKVGRFSTLVMFLSRADKQSILNF